MNPLRHFAVALSFLTSLPVRIRDVSAMDLGRSIVFFPLVGLVLGLTLSGIERLTRGHLAPELVAVGIVALLASLTGGLHIDGLADVFDGLAGRRGDRERMLAIMRDSRIGSLGATALFFALLAKVFAIGAVLRSGALWPLWAFPVAGRWAVTPLVVWFRSARSEGLGQAFHSHGHSVHVVFATLFAALIIGYAGQQAILPTVAALVAALAIGVWLDRRLGGLTGDVYGAAVELSELAFLIVASRTS